MATVALCAAIIAVYYFGIIMPIINVIGEQNDTGTIGPKKLPTPKAQLA